MRLFLPALHSTEPPNLPSVYVYSVEGMMVDKTERVWTAEASGLGFPAGLWPPSYEVDGVMFCRRGEGIYSYRGEDRELVGFVYESRDGQGLMIYND